MHENPDTAALETMRRRIRALQAKTVGNGCTEDEALAAATKVAELLDRYDLSLSDVALRAAACVQVVHESRHNKRIPLAECIDAVAHFCDCRTWREKDGRGQTRFVFFGLPADAEAALYLTGLIDETIRTQLGLYKTGPEYQRFRHQDRHLANASFALGMVTSIAEKLMAMKDGRDRANRACGRDLVLVKSSVVEAEFATLGLVFSATQGPGRMILPQAYDAGGEAGAALPITRGRKA